MMDDRSAAQTIHGLNIFRMALVVMLPLSALLTPKDPSVYLSKWGIAAVIYFGMFEHLLRGLFKSEMEIVRQ